MRVVVCDRQYFGAEEVASVRLTMAAVERGLRMASAQGQKTWETYFVLHSDAPASDPFRPGSSLAWFGRQRWSGEGDARTYGEASSVQGRLYLSFSWVEQLHSGSASAPIDGGIRVLPQPLPWPDRDVGSAQRQQRRAALAERWQTDDRPLRILVCPPSFPPRMPCPCSITCHAHSSTPPALHTLALLPLVLPPRRSPELSCECVSAVLIMG